MFHLLGNVLVNEDHISAVTFHKDGAVVAVIYPAMMIGTPKVAFTLQDRLQIDREQAYGLALRLIGFHECGIPKTEARATPPNDMTEFPMGRDGVVMTPDLYMPYPGEPTRTVDSEAK